MYMMVLEKLFILDLQKVSGKVERKICAVGVTKIITDMQMLINNDGYNRIWFVFLLRSSIELFLHVCLC